MNTQLKYAKSNNGIIHVINPISGNEFTLCGDAFNIGDGDPQHPEYKNEWQLCPAQTVTCSYCAEIILACRAVKDIASPSKRRDPRA